MDDDRSDPGTPAAVRPRDGAAAEGAAPAAPERSRLEQLFRHALRHGAVNPLLYAVQHYRNEEEQV